LPIDFDKQNFKSINKLFKKVANEPYSINTINQILKEIDEITRFRTISSLLKQV
jgi:hypothetical protein